MEAKTKIFGQHDEATIKQIESCVAAGGDRGVLCADGHKGYAQPIGGVVAYKDKISLSGVAFDIACGNLAIRTDAKRHEIAPKIDKIMDDVVHEISFGIGRKSKTRVEHELFNDPAWELQPMLGEKTLRRGILGRAQRCDAGVSRTERLRRRQHGRRRCDYRRGRLVDLTRSVVFDYSWCGANHVAHCSQRSIRKSWKEEDSARW